MNITGISPLWITFLSFLITVETGVGTGNVKLDHVFPPEWIPWVVGWCGFLAFIGNAMVTAMSTLQSAKPGLFVKDQAAVKSVLAAALAIGTLFLFAGGAHAQGLKVRLPDPLKLNQQQTTADTTPSGLAKFMSDLETLKKEVVDGTVADLQAADADASVLTNASDPTSFRDPIAHACYPAAVKFLQSLPASTAPTGTFIAVQMFQKKRDFVSQIQAGLPVYLKLGCAPLLGDEAQVFTKLMGLVGIKVALSSLIPGAGTLAGLSF